MGPALSGSHVFSSMVFANRVGHGRHRWAGSAFLPSRETHCCRDSKVVENPLASVNRSLRHLRERPSGHERSQFNSFGEIIFQFPRPAALAQADAGRGICLLVFGSRSRSIGKKKDSILLVASLVRRNPVGVARETWVTVLCPSRVEGQPYLRPLSRGGRRAHLSGEPQACSSTFRDPFVCNFFFHCIYLTFVNILVLLADHLQRCEIWVGLRASNRLHRLRAWASALRLTKVVVEGDRGTRFIAKSTEATANLSVSGMTDPVDRIDLPTQCTEDIIGDFESLGSFAAAPALPGPAPTEIDRADLISVLSTSTLQVVPRMDAERSGHGEAGRREGRDELDLYVAEIDERNVLTLG